MRPAPAETQRTGAVMVTITVMIVVMGVGVAGTCALQVRPATREDGRATRAGGDPENRCGDGDNNSDDSGDGGGRGRHVRAASPPSHTRGRARDPRRRRPREQVR